MSAPAMNRAEAAKIAYRLFINAEFLGRGAVGHAWTTDFGHFVGLRLPNPIDPGKFYRIERGRGFNYADAIADAKKRRAGRS